jgi:hypothetical protein
MTYLSANAIMIDTLGREATPSTNTEYDFALQSGALSDGGILGWLGRTAIVKAVIARKAKRDLTRAVARLAETSPHLLADIGIIDTPAIAHDMSIRARFEAAGEETRIVAAPVPVAPRPANRPAINVPRRGPAPAAVAPAVSLGGKEQTVTQ